MNVKGFFYSLNAPERAELVKLVGSIILEREPNELVLTPIRDFVDIYRYEMSTLLRKRLIKATRSLPRFVENITEDQFKKRKELGDGSWREFSRLRDEMISKNEKVLNDYGITNEKSNDIR